MSATDVPDLGVLAIGQVIVRGGSAVDRLVYRLASKNPEVQRYKTLAIASHGRAICLMTEDPPDMQSVRIWAASDAEIAQFFKNWSDTHFTLDSWLALIKAEFWLNQGEKERLEKFYAVYKREAAR